jgi:hypothetical protein
LFRKRIHDAEKIWSTALKDFFNRIDPLRTSDDQRRNATAGAALGLVCRHIAMRRIGGCGLLTMLAAISILV